MAGAPTFVLAKPAPFGLRAAAVLAGDRALATGPGCDGAAGLVTCAAVWLRPVGVDRFALRTLVTLAIAGRALATASDVR